MKAIRSGSAETWSLRSDAKPGVSRREPERFLDAISQAFASRNDFVLLEVEVATCVVLAGQRFNKTGPGVALARVGHFEG